MHSVCEWLQGSSPTRFSRFTPLVSLSSCTSISSLSEMSRTGHEYILIDFSGYVFLKPCKNADAETTSNVLMEYFSAFAPVLQWFSDQGRHFRNKVIQNLSTSQSSTVSPPFTRFGRTAPSNPSARKFIV